MPKDPWADGGLTIEMPDPHCTAASQFKAPQDLHIINALPRNADGKVLKTALREVA